MAPEECPRRIPARLQERWPTVSPVLHTRLRAAGCYAYHIDGTTFSRVIVFRGNGSDRQLRVFNANRDLVEVVREIADATEAAAAPA